MMKSFSDELAEVSNRSHAGKGIMFTFETQLTDQVKKLRGNVF